ncbi:hypothetical protein OSCT_1218 [Oscillochloris trichoides DG-6]|uniref:site-specific DNA-methyltransferase (adenine-specific) n=1 Tax=Oscillochloris trichoides DG-6 TaxID=765420 RepID=E1ID17_9CHLR|nr:N-6 DNA methylase [Oscillochloris trichoides]EFO80926.1 hypothetical protein OSCT_1218 [Oscillochloris trichoides DG-6]
MSVLNPALLADLSDAAALRRLFVALGFTPQEQIRYSAQTLDWPDAVAVDLRGRAFELLADTDSGFFQVLLLPPDQDAQGLAQTLLQRLFASLEQRGHEAILLLPTSDWSLIDLVLLADPRPLAERQGPPSLLRWSFAPLALRPHHLLALDLLAVHAAGPGEATECAIRSFRRAQQERFFRSVNFFSTYYLEQRIATDPTLQVGTTWQNLLPTLPALRPTLAVHDPRAILAALGWSLVPGQAGAPDRVQAAGVDAALVAILPPDHPLDAPLSATHYPQLELIAALEQQRQSGGLTWALLTNGRTWRLYSHLTASISGAFYEVELADLLAVGGDDDLAYFVAFFGPTGLAGNFAQVVFASSQMLARDIGEDLKQVVFRQVFRLLANAIADDLKRRGAYEGSVEQLQLIFRTTLILLYRLLFVLYAESMRLLPTMHMPYYRHSLTFLLSDIALQPFVATQERKPMTPTAYWAWQHLKDLFAAIDAGQPTWGVPKYNGGLFSVGATDAAHKEPHRLLAHLSLGAMDLCKALDLLGRDAQARAAQSQDEARRLIDYAGLDVRRLGGIYEGLLEFQLVEDASGTLELKHTRADRKASGSYYTPDYIVAYIVEQAVGPVLEARAKAFDSIMCRLPAARRELERATRDEGNQRISIETAKANSDAARTQVEKLEREAIESLLDLKILDPAMGSGHFLVAAVNFVTDRLIVILDRYREGNPVLARLDAIREQIRTSLKEQEINDLISDEQLNNLNLLRRLVMKRCVFGVDLNDMAVELARLSLWLNSFTVGAPLNFLDHHLKWGNSLIGARVQAVQQAMEGKHVAGLGTQLDMFTSGSAFAEMLNLGGMIEQLVEIADANAKQVEESERLYAAYEATVVPIKRLLDLWVAQSFGSREAAQLIQLYSGERSDVVNLVDALLGKRSLDPASQRGVDYSRQLFQRHRFLHWDLDFPEVFIDLPNKAWKPADQMGFDAVVGNPPYDELSEDERGSEIEERLYFDKEPVYNEAISGRTNLFRLFIAQSLEITTAGKYHSFIIPMSLLGDRFSLEIRRKLLTKHQFVLIEAFPQKDDPNKRIFFDAKLPTCIYVLKAHQSEGISFQVRTHSGRKIDPKSISYKPTPAELLSFDTEGAIIPLADKQTWTLCTRISQDRCIIKWSEVARMITGEVVFNQQFRRFLTKDASKSLVLRGGHIQRYYLLEDPKQGEPVYIDMNLWMDSSKEGSGAYAHKKARIVFQESAALDNWRRIIAAYLPAGNVCGHKICYFVDVKISEMALLAIFNSHLINWRFSLVSTTNNLSAYQIHNLPIRRITFTTPAAQREALREEGQRLYAARGTAYAGNYAHWREWREYWAELWQWVDARLPEGGNEQSDVVHDLLAYLAELMIAFHKEKQTEAASFTDWLATQTGSTLDEWSLKTVVQSFWEQPWEEIERAVQKNRGRIVQTQGLRGKAAEAALEPLLREIRGRWAGAVGRMGPVLAAIQATDRLIDLIVYRLYGLNDAEIDLVEG